MKRRKNLSFLELDLFCSLRVSNVFVLEIVSVLNLLPFLLSFKFLFWESLNIHPFPWNVYPELHLSFELWKRIWLTNRIKLSLDWLSVRSGKKFISKTRFLCKANVLKLLTHYWITQHEIKHKFVFLKYNFGTNLNNFCLNYKNKFWFLITDSFLSQSRT